MKFWECAIFGTGLMSALTADSSVVWCLIFGIACAISIWMQKQWKEIEAEYKCYEAQKGTTPMAVENDAWVGHCESIYPTSDSITVWEMYQ